MIDGERTLLTGDWVPDDGRDAGGEDARRGHPGPALRALSGAARMASAPGTSTACSRICSAAASTSPRPTRCSPSTATTTCASSTTARSCGAWRGSTGPPTPTTWCPAAPARRRRSPSTCGRAATRPRSASGSATRSRTSTLPSAVGRFFVVANGPERDPGPARGDRRSAQRHRHRGPQRRRRLRGGGLDPGREALVGSLAAARGRGCAADATEQGVGEPRGDAVQSQQPHQPEACRRPASPPPRRSMIASATFCGGSSRSFCRQSGSRSRS